MLMVDEEMDEFVVYVGFVLWEEGYVMVMVDVLLC